MRDCFTTFIHLYTHARTRDPKYTHTGDVMRWNLSIFKGFFVRCFVQKGVREEHTFTSSSFLAFKLSTPLTKDLKCGKGRRRRQENTWKRMRKRSWMQHRRLLFGMDWWCIIRMFLFRTWFQNWIRQIGFSFQRWIQRVEMCLSTPG